MARDERQVITKEDVRKSIKGFWVHFIIIWTVIWLPVLLMFLFFSAISKFFLWLDLLMFLVYIIVLVYVGMQHQKGKHSHLLFIKDKLVGIAEAERVVRTGRGHRTENAFYFAEHDRVVAGNTDIRLASYGDEYLLVVWEHRPDEVVAYYNLRFYRPDKFDR